MADRKAVVFCSASFDIDERYNDLARDVVRTLYGCGYGMVSGGTVKGTMKVIADEARRLGMEHVGIVPVFMKGVEYSDASELIWTDTMSERKEAMRAGTCLAVALPGLSSWAEEDAFCAALFRKSSIGAMLQCAALA